MNLDGQRADILSLLSELVAIDSVNPDLVPGAAGESGVAEHIVRWAQAAGLRVEVSLVEPGRPNVIVTAPGSGGGRSVMLNAHTDVVGVDAYESPFAVRIEGRRMYGRGVLDTKVGVATALVIARDAAALGLSGDVVVAAVVDEECGSKGTEHLIDSGLRTDAAIVLEPTDLTIVHAHRGWAWGRVTVHGRAAHGSRPQLGVDAIVHAAPILSGLAQLQAKLDRQPHAIVGAASIHASLIRGGSEMSTYPGRCEIDIERRNIPGEDASTLASDLATLAAGVDASARVEWETSMSRSPLLTATDEPIVRALVAAGAGLDVGAATFWTDAALLSEAGIPSVVFGPSGGGIHETVEWLDLDSFDVFHRVLCNAVCTFCS